MNQTFTFRKVLVFSFILFLSANAGAQVLPKGFAAGLHIGAIQSFTDVTEADINADFGAGVQYNLNDFTFGNLEYSMGRLSRKELDVNEFAFTNKYNRVSATANVALGQFLKPDFRVAHYFLYNIYAGTGVGFIMSNISEPNALSHNKYGGITYQGTDVTLPVNLGFNFKISSYLYPDSPVTINVNMQHNFTFTEMLDGYDTSFAANRYKDAFSSLSVGLKYNFGEGRRMF